MKNKSVRGLAILMAAAMTYTTFFGTSMPVQAADEVWVSDEDLAEKETEEPEPDTVLPDANQYKYQKDELAAFCHFGPNTWSGYEWGFNQGSQKWLYEGMSPSEIFRLEKDFDADTLVRTLQEAGFKKLIVTAKHHDGFCIWNSKWTEYDVANTNYKNGEGDILEEISTACTKYNMDMGLYLSPWDVAEDSYGYKDAEGNKTDKDHDVEDYNEYYNNQLEEILGSPKYGNNGHFVEVWMDGANGYVNNPQEYDFEKWFETIQKYEGKPADYEADCMLFGAEAYTTVRWIGNENGTAAKNTWSKSMVDKTLNTINSNSQGGHTIGLENGNQWTVPEADARITSGWFWSPTKNVPKTIEALSSMYFNSVGHNATLLLNIPPNTDGTVDDAILERVKEFGDNIKETFDDNMAAAEGAKVMASEVRGGDVAFKPSNTVDGKDDTYWTTNDNTNEGSLLIDLGSSKKIDVISIEEAIQNGQRINEYKVEYRNGGGNWILLEEGETIGAKRLVRVPAVTATQVRITVATPADKVPMISEVGVYKASKDFELAAAAPAGMEVIDVRDKDVSDGIGFSFSTGWTDQTGSEYVNETNTWANKGASFTLQFNGTKVYLVGTKDPNHGTAKIRIDEGEPITVDTHAASRSTGQVWFESPDMSDGPHTLELTVDSAAIGVEAAYVINNGGVGMIGLETDEYTVNEDSTLDVKVKRVGGTTGRIKAMLSPNPGTAIQGDFDTEPIVVTIPHGESEVTVPVVINRNENVTGDRAFTIEMNSPSSNLILGFIDTATVNIIDAESMTKEQLEELVASVDGWTKDLYAGDWDSFAAALTSANALLDEEDPDALEMGKAYAALENAKETLSVRTQFTEEDPVVFPTKQGESVKVEAEFLERVNAGGNTHEFSLNNNESLSNGQSVGWFVNGNKMNLYYNAPTTGTYTVTMKAASGNTAQNPNHIILSEKENKISASTVNVSGSNANNPIYEETEFEITVNTSGPGVLELATDSSNGPDIDCFTITPKNIVSIFDVVTSVGEGGTATTDVTTVGEGGNVTLEITPDTGYKISSVMVGDNDVTTDLTSGDDGSSTYTITGVSADTTIEVAFELVNYTEENRFEFPTKVADPDDTDTAARTLEAEYLVLDSTGVAANKAIRVSEEKDGSSNGKCIDYFEVGNKAYIYYYAEKTGTYAVTLTYASGRGENNPNDITFSEENGNITEITQSFTRGSGDQYGSEWQEKKFEFVVTEPGVGVIALTTENGGPVLDKFDIELVEVTGTLADEMYKVDLEIAIQDANKEIKVEDATEGTYTAESIAALKTALTAAQAVFGDTSATQEEVDAQLEALQAAIEDLEPPTYEITATVAGDVGGTIQPSASTVERGESVDFTITPNYGYTATKITVNNTEILSNASNTTTFYGPNGTYSISNITEDQNVVVTFEKTGYTVDEPFAFPTVDESVTLEAEDFTLYNTGALSENWKLSVSNGTWDGASVSFINSMNSGDIIRVPYTATAGTYDVTVYYRSGSNSNALQWTGDTITSGTASAGASSANTTKNVSFTVTVEEDGSGVWTFTAPSGNSPQIDRFVIQKHQDTPEPQTVTVTASVEGGNGTVSMNPENGQVTAGEDVVLTFSPNEGYAVEDVLVNNVSVMEQVTGNTYTLADVTENTTVVVKYAFAHYTQGNPFYFPTEVNGEVKTLEAEYFILQNSGEGEDWPLQISEAETGENGWPSNGKFVNSLDSGDTITLYYYAQKAGNYTVTMQYQSGSGSNSIIWTENSGYITNGSATVEQFNAWPNDLQPYTQTFTWTVETPGAGVLTITTGDSGAPQLDKFDIQLVEETETVPVDKTALNSKIEEAEAEASKTDVYTADSIAVLNQAIETAKAVAGNADATQEQVDEQIELLNGAIKALEEQTSTEYKVTVNAPSEEEGTIIFEGLGENGTVAAGEDVTYTIQAKEGYVIAELTINGRAVTEAAGLASFTGMLADIAENVTVNLTFRESDPAQPVIPEKEALWDALEKAYATLEQTDKYTAASLAEYKAVVDEARAIYDLENATEEQISSAIANLEDAKRLLVGFATPGTGDEDKPGTGEPSGSGAVTGNNGAGTDNNGAVQTGDAGNPMLWIILLTAACAAGVAVIRLRLNKSEKR